MKNKLNHVIFSCFLAVLFSTQAVANSQIQEDFAYAFGSAEGLDSGRISLLSPQEMDETEGLFLGWLIRLGPIAARKTIAAFKIVKVQLFSGRKQREVWIRFGRSHSSEKGFKTFAIRWGSNRYHRDDKIKDIVLKEFNQKLHETKIPINTWRTNQPGHLHLLKWRKWMDNLRPKPPASSSHGPHSTSLAHSARGDNPVVSPALHTGSGGVIDSTVDWELITAEDLLNGRYDESILKSAAKGPKGRGWGMEELTEEQARLGLSILAFVVDPENNAEIDIPLKELWGHLRMSVHLGRNPRKNDRAARLAKLGLKQLEYIIGQHRQDYHPTEENMGRRPGDTHTLSAARTDATYLPIQAHWWLHDFNYRR